jgi:multiple sugar transport system permease protein
MSLATAEMIVRTKPKVDPRWLTQRRWARAAWIYFLLIIFSLVFIGPLLMGTISSLKTNPDEYPPRLYFEQLKPANWASAYGLGVAGGGDGFLGGFRPGAQVKFEVSYLVPDGTKILVPEVSIPKRRAGAGAGAFSNTDYAADYAKLAPLEQTALVPAAMPDGKPGQRVTYQVTIDYPKEAKNISDPSKPAPFMDRVPLDINSSIDHVYASATLDPTRLERIFAPIASRPYPYPRVQSYDNLAPGVIGYVFRNYVRVFKETRSITTGQSLFFNWVTNSFLLVILRIISTVILASMAGYAMARLNFPFKNAFFVFVIFTMTVPGQVTFISNYLVLKDGIWGLSRLWGQGSLLNSIVGLWMIGLVGAGSVFLMKQFFETLPKELEESAKIDGATTTQTFWRVIMPLAGPALGALIITTAQGAWNEYFWALVVLANPQDNYTLPIGLNSFNRFYGSTGDYGLILAGAVFSAIPVIVLFIVFQRYFVEGVAFTGGKE